MTMVAHVDPRHLIESVRTAARRHGETWAELVPSSSAVNLAAEAEEEAAYEEMAEAKRRLREHISATYGVTLNELANLAGR